MLPDSLANSYIGLGPRVSLKDLEARFVFNAGNDELYELNQEAFTFMAGLDGSRRGRDLVCDTKFLEYAAGEHLLAFASKPFSAAPHIGSQEGMSLRYLLLTITTRCNLSCRHCYLGDADREDMDIGLFDGIIEDFAGMGGLRLLVSGGEPTLHPDFKKFNLHLKEQPFRRVLLTNGTTITEDLSGTLEFDEVQISLDGLCKGHDWLRGAGSFDKALRGLQIIGRAGCDLSVSTMIHSRNVDEFPELEDLVHELGAVSWTIDYPSETGRAALNTDLLVDLALIENIMARQFGSEIHESAPGYTCGSHLAAITPSGKLTKCGFYDDWSGGSVVGRRLARAWTGLEKLTLDKLECQCEYVADCRGGCRFRAESNINGNRYSADPVRCRILGVSK